MNGMGKFHHIPVESLRGVGQDQVLIGNLTSFGAIDVDVVVSTSLITRPDLN